MKPIQFGLLFYPHHAIGAPPQALVQAAVEHARVAEDLGFDHLWTGHHYLTDDQTMQPVPLLARLAAEVQRIRMGAWFILSLANPVDMAEQLASLDAIMEGRLICGAVLGYRDTEFQNLGVPKSERVKRFEDAITLLKRLWTEDNITYKGHHTQLSDASIYPKPVQKPRPPIWVGGNSPPAIRRAARIGDAWAIGPYADVATLQEQLQLYDEALREVGREPAAVIRPILRDVYIAQDKNRAFREAEQYMAPFYQTYVKWGKEEAMGRPGELTRPFQELSQGRFLIGDPGYFVEEIHHYHEQLGVDTFIFQINRPEMPTEVVLEGVRLLGERVLPKFR